MVSSMSTAMSMPITMGTPCAPPTPTAGGCGSGDVASLERVRYFARQLIAADDLTQEQLYFRAKLKRHNRLLHGWGVVCGAEVKAVPSVPYTVEIEPGYVLGPGGDEILIDGPIRVDISKQGLDGNTVSVCGDAVDPWCATVRVDRQAPQVLYVAVAYSECLSRPVHVQGAGCSCGGGGCEYSRVRDGFVVRILDRLPSSYDKPCPGGDPFACPTSGVRPCPDCVSEPWVILARINLTGSAITDQNIDNYTYRRYVASFGNWCMTCPPPGQPVQPPAPVALLHVRNVRLLAQGEPGGILVIGERAVADLNALNWDPRNTLFEPAIQRANIIEVEFEGAVPEHASITDLSFTVTSRLGQKRGVFTFDAARPNAVRWRGEPSDQGNREVFLPSVPYTLTLVGDAANPAGSIRAAPPAGQAQGPVLDGETKPLPSGNGIAGGNFVFTFEAGDRPG